MKFLNSLAARIAAFGFAAMTLLSACTVVVEEPRPLPPPRPQPGFCTREYDPVCARRGDDRQTFANSCLADAARLPHHQARRMPSWRRWRRRRRGDRQGLPEEFLDPVCARRGNDSRTFANSCRADEAGFRVLYQGECGAGGGGGGAGGDQQFCTREYAPVCARRGSNVRTFPNQCEAEGAGYRVVSDRPC